MKVHMKYQTPDLTIDQVFEGTGSEEVVKAMQRGLSARMGGLMGMVVNAMGPLQFAQEVVRRYNISSKSNQPVPHTCEEFLNSCRTAGILEDVK